MAAEFLPLVQMLKRVYPVAEPPFEFRQTLYARLIGEAQRLKTQPALTPGTPLLRRAMVGAAALSVAGLALVVWRGRTLFTHGQLHTAQGS